MRRLHLPIQNPCHEDWTAMASDGESRRFCDVCTKHVHDLSAMTESVARDVLASESAKGRVCVRYTTDTAGNIKFKAETVEAPSLWRMTLAAASMALALLTGCADSEPDRVTNDECVYEVGPWSFTAERGQGTCPAVEPEPEPLVMGQLEAVIEPPPPEPIHERMGDMPAEPMGVVAPIMDPPPPPPEPKPVLMGKIAPPEPVHEVKGEIAAVRAEEPCDPQEKTMLGEVL
jgi:hypothetical protein